MTTLERLINENKNLRLEILNLKSTLNQSEKSIPKDDKIKVAYLVICRMFYGDIALKTRKIEMVRGRQFFYNYVRKKTNLSLNAMAEVLFNFSQNSPKLKTIQDHTTIIHALEEFDKFYLIDKKYKAQYDEFLSKLETELSENTN